MAIVKMKKASIVTLSKSKNETVSKLKEIGLLHINLEKVESENIEKLNKTRDNLDRIINGLSSKDNVQNEALSKEKTKEKIDEINSILSNIDSHQEELDKIEKEIKRIKPWGSFNPDDISDLKQKSVELNLYEILSSDFEKLNSKKDIFVVGKKDNSLLIVSINKKITFNNLTEFELPEESLSSLDIKSNTLKKKIEDENSKFLSYKKYLVSIKDYKKALEEDIEFENVNGNLKEISEVPVAIIEGFLPLDKIENLKGAAKSAGWGLMIKDPSENDKVPTLLKNAPPTKLINPLINFIELSPGYHESDISIWFLIFFSIFFAMIIGDAGYGSIFFAVALLMSVGSLAKGKGLGQVHGLLFVLSIFTIFWGSVTGTWFGTTLAEKVPFLKSLEIPKLKNDSFVQFLCFCIAIVHLTIAHLIGSGREMGKGNIGKGIGYLGQLVMSIGLFYIVLSLIVKDLDIFKYINSTYPDIATIALYLIGGGFAVVFLFSNQEGTGFIKGVLNSLSNIIGLVLGIVGGFADIISYIRLFAVGLAGAAISDSFNSMASGMMSGNPVVGLIGAILLLLFAHTLNIVMSLLSVLVHGVRLNVLEFSMHLGNEWSGIAYNPFRNKNLVLKN